MSTKKEVSDNIFTLDRFKRSVVILIAVITGILMAITYQIVNGYSYLTLTLFTLLLVYFIYRLFSLVNKTNRNLTNFLLSIRFDDFETTYTQNRLNSDDGCSLHNAFNLITGKFRDIRSEKEAQHQFLLTLVEQVETGLICFDETGKTVLMNRAIQQLLHKSYLPTIESIRKIDIHLYDTLTNFTPGDRQLQKVQFENDLLQLAIVGTVLKANDQTLKLFSFQNINNELDRKEMESWGKLIRILTHEIMNSVTPVVSLAATTDDLITHAKGLDEETRTDIHQAIHAIQKRSELLLDFTIKYRELTRIPTPELEDFNIKALLERIVILHGATIEENKIEIITQFPPYNVTIHADQALIEQAFINLIKNSIEALDGHHNPKLEIRLHKDKGEAIIQIADNGDGIEEDMLDQIFIPFFTTKKEGSGIGLSLCRQIILMHNGSINVNSELGKGTVFTVRL